MDNVQCTEKSWRGLVWPSIAAADNTRLQDFVAFWKAGCVDGGLPPRAHLDPLKLRRSDLGWIVLSEREAPRTYRYRLFGTQMTRLIGRDLTGQVIDALSMDGSAEPFLTMLETVAERREPIFLHGDLFWERKEYRSFQQVTVAFADGEGAPRYLCTLVDILNPL